MGASEDYDIVGWQSGFGLSTELLKQENDMNNSYRLLITVALVVAALLVRALPGQAQGLPKDPAEREKVIAQIMQGNARQITLFDRTGKEVGTVGPKDLYNQPVLSPDNKRVAVIKTDLSIEKENNDLWIFDIATGKGTQITMSREREGASSPAWSPDGSQIAFAALRNGYFGVYRTPSNGTGTEELLYKASAPVTITDWSIDGRFIGYFSTDLGGGALFALPLEGTGERKPIEIFKSPKQVQGVRFSPDSRYVAYTSNETGKTEVYIRPFDPAAAPGAAPAKGPWQISEQGGQGMSFFRRDGKEFYFLAADRSIMAVPVTLSPDFKFEKPRVLFRPAESALTGVAPGTAMISRDGDRVVIAVPPPQLRQLTIYDREGKVVSKVGPPGFYQQPGFSPDGKHLVVMRTDGKTSNLDIWTFDVETGKGYAITDDVPPENAPIFSPDGKQVAYVSTREQYAGIYRKAWDGTGEEEMVFRYTPGAGMVLTDWSPNGQFMTFYTGVLNLVNLRGQEKVLDRKAIEWLREDYDAVDGRFSPDGRYLAFLSNEKTVDKLELYVRPFDPNKPNAPAGPAVQVSKNGAMGMVFWRQDMKEMFFMTRDWEVMSVDITAGPTFQAGTPKLLFKMPGPLPGNPAQWKNITPDGQRFVFAMPPAPGGAPR
jgi:Tol biopolymer transport system component